MPALFTKVSIVPISLDTVSTADFMLFLSVISIGTTIHSPPADLISSANDSSFSFLRADIATFAPQEANTFEKRYPSPEDAPVTKAI